MNEIKKTVEPIKEIPVKNLAHLEEIYKASQDEWEEKIHPIFKIGDRSELYFCHKKEIFKGGPEGYVFYTATELEAAGEHDYFVRLEEGSFYLNDGPFEVDPDQLIYTGQDFHEYNRHDSNDGQCLFSATTADLQESSEVVLGAFYHSRDPFSVGYIKLADAREALGNSTLLNNEERKKSIKMSGEKCKLSNSTHVFDCHCNECYKNVVEYIGIKKGVVYLYTGDFAPQYLQGKKVMVESFLTNENFETSSCEAFIKLYKGSGGQVEWIPRREIMNNLEEVKV